MSHAAGAFAVDHLPPFPPGALDDPGGLPAAVEVRSVYRGIVTSTKILPFPGRPWGARARPDFTVGWRAGVDAPLGPEFVPSDAHPLVAPSAGACLIHTTPAMTGELRVRDQTASLASYVRERGPTFLLPPAASLRLVCGASTFLVARTTAPRRLPVPWMRWREGEWRYPLAALLAFALAALMVAFTPGDPRSLSLDLLNMDPHFLPILVKPPEVEATPDWLNGKKPVAGGGGSSARGPEGAAGRKTAPVRDARLAVKGQADNRDPRLAKEAAREEALQSGILGTLALARKTSLASIFGEENALGNDTEDALGHLVGRELADAWGLGGLGKPGSGDREGGGGEGLLGPGGGLTTVGVGNGPGQGPGHGYGRYQGALRTRHAKAPDPIEGIGQVRGALDKEIVRRIVRRHINEVRYCYEGELAKNPALGGRIVAQFVIAGTGQVVNSVLQSSSMANVKVESCTLQAIRRWQFPQPAGGGTVIVSYPFVLAPAGAGG